MNSELNHITHQMKDSYDGEPWFGRNIQELLSEINEDIAFQKPSGQHSIVELLWHMITWKEFTISRLKEVNQKALQQFESEDWRELDHTDKTLWKKGLQEFERLHNELVAIVSSLPEGILEQKVKERKYDFRHLLNGIVQHDIYHVGQIAYVKKVLS